MKTEPGPLMPPKPAPKKLKGEKYVMYLDTSAILKSVTDAYMTTVMSRFREPNEFGNTWLEPEDMLVIIPSNGPTRMEKLG